MSIVSKCTAISTLDHHQLLHLLTVKVEGDILLLQTGERGQEKEEAEYNKDKGKDKLEGLDLQTLVVQASREEEWP